MACVEITPLEIMIVGLIPIAIGAGQIIADRWAQYRYDHGRVHHYYGSYSKVEAAWITVGIGIVIEVMALTILVMTALRSFLSP